MSANATLTKRLFKGGISLAQELDRGNRATLADIAKASGVSINTVSRALRTPQTVRPALRKKIESVAAELNYLPNRLAGGLAGGTTSVVGVIITSLFYSEFAATIDTLQAELAAGGLSVMLGNSRYDADEEWRLIKAMMSWRPAAIVLVGVDHSAKASTLLASADIPVIEIWDFQHEPMDIVVGMDHAAIGKAQATHLLDQGYRQLAFVGALRTNDHRARKRQEGFAAEVANRVGHAPKLAAEAVGGTPDLGAKLTFELLAKHPHVDGIATNGDVMAFGVLSALRQIGRAVPDDVGVIGFGDNEGAACMQPALSSMRPPRADIGRAAARAILRRIDEETAASVRFEAQLIQRQSSAGPKLHQRLKTTEGERV